MVNKKPSNTTSNSDALMYINLCNYITKKWFPKKLDPASQKVSMTNYANQCDLATSTITKIANAPEGYIPPLKTIIKICRKEETSLSQLFSDFEKEYGIKY